MKLTQRIFSGATIAIATALFLVAGMGFVTFQSYKANAQFRNVSEEDKSIIGKVNASPNFGLAFDQDADAPLKIVSAEVKKITGSDFEALTNNKTALGEVISAPTVKLNNSSEKTISRIMILIRDGKAEHAKGISMRELKIEPGANFTITPENFVRGQDMTYVKTDGQTGQIKVEAMTQPKYWLPFADLSNLKLVVSVEFEDGSMWYDRSERDVETK